MFDERQNRTGPRLQRGPLLSSIGIPRASGQHLTATIVILKVDASFDFWISNAFFRLAIAFSNNDIYTHLHFPSATGVLAIDNNVYSSEAIISVV